MKYYFYFIDDTDGRGVKGRSVSQAAMRESVYNNRSSWVGLSTAQTTDIAAYLTSGHNMGRDNVVYNDKSYMIHSSFLDTTDLSDLFVVFVCIRDNREVPFE